jgi:acyl-CoA thioester hydrolase
MNNELPTRKDFTRSIDLQLRFRDLDSAGHVNNAVYGTFFEAARCDLLVEDNKWIEQDETTGFLLRAIEIVFHKPIVFPHAQSIDVCTAITKIGNSSVQLRQAIFVGDVCCATSNSTMVHAKDGKSQPIPDFVRQALLR